MLAAEKLIPALVRDNTVMEGDLKRVWGLGFRV